MASMMKMSLPPQAAKAMAGIDVTTMAAKAASAKGASDRSAKIRGTAEDFEQVFLNTMFQQMFANVGQGPFSGGNGANMWRSFLTDEYSKSFVKSGGIGIASEVQRQLTAQQEMQRQLLAQQEIR